MPRIEDRRLEAGDRGWLQPAGNLDVVDELCTKGFVGHDPLAGDQDLAAAKASISLYRSAFPDLHFTIEDASSQATRSPSAGPAPFENSFMGLRPDARARSADPRDHHRSASRTARSPRAGRAGTR